MKRLLIYLATLLISINSINSQENEMFDWNPIMNAIIEIESGGNPNAVGGNSVGVLQITPITVEQCNIILRLKKSLKRYELIDRKNIRKSKEIFILIQEYYNPQHNLEKAIRLWNGGPNYSIKGTQKYFEKVMRCYNKNRLE
jgi:soluble lytic murein transglycosylase-like protein